MTKCVFAALLLASSVAVAEDQYPASDFKPKVVYQDETATKSSESSSSSVSKSSSASSSASDSQYPAANFEPKVLYTDENYKHNSAVPGNNSSSSISSDSSSLSGAGTAGGAVQKEESSVGYLLGLIALAVAGFVLFKKGAILPKSSVSSSTSSATRNPSGLTGVGRYILKTSGTGVSRYLEQKAKTASSSAAATGVAKYLANQVSSSKATASQAVTGVEKYMRKKG